MDEAQQQLQLAMWLRHLTTCEIPFQNTTPIDPVESICVFNNVTKETYFCPFIARASTEGGIVTVLAFIATEEIDNCDFAYTAPVHWIEKLHEEELRYVQSFMEFQNASVINYVTVFMNKLVSYTEFYTFYHDKISEEGPNRSVEQLECILTYLCEMVEQTGEKDILRQLSVATLIVDSFFDFFDVVPHQELVLMACDRVRKTYYDNQETSSLELDEEIWGDIL